MTAPQHTVKFRIAGRLIDVSCPPWASLEQLDAWLAETLREHRDCVLVSKSWPNAPAKPQ
jgi:hypothetical protein